MTIEGYLAQHGHSVTALAKHLGVHRVTVSNWKGGHQAPSYEYWSALHELGITDFPRKVAVELELGAGEQLGDRVIGDFRVLSKTAKGARLGGASA